MPRTTARRSSHRCPSPPRRPPSRTPPPARRRKPSPGADMDLDVVKKRLNAIGWQEQVDAEIAERPSIAAPVDRSFVDARLRELAHSVDQELLDQLEREPGYEIWTLRLAAFFDETTAKQRAPRHLERPNWRLRHWARLIAGLSP